MYAEDLVVSDRLKAKGRLVYYPHYQIRHYREYGDRNLEYYFQSLMAYLKAIGMSDCSLKAVKWVIRWGLRIRFVAYAILCLFSRRFTQRRLRVKRQLCVLHTLNPS